jgi:hypothetical protein
VINDPRNRERLRRAIDALQLVADSCQANLNIASSYGVEPTFVGQLLKLGRTTDTIERVLGELHGLLDHPPHVGGAQQLRALPDHARQLDSQPQPGLAVAAAGDGGAAAA